MGRSFFGCLTGLVLVGVLMATSTPATAAAIMIDDFTAGTNLSTTSNTGAFNDGPSAGIFGAFRDTTLTRNTNIIFTNFPVNATYTPVGLVYTGALNTGTYTSVYDSFNSGGLNANLVTASFNDRFEVNIIGTLGSADLTLSLVDTAAVASSVTHSISTGDFGALEFLFADFASDVTSIHSITFSMTTTSPLGAAIAISSIQAVPEPTTAALLAVGTLLMLRRPRRSRVAA